MRKPFESVHRQRYARGGMRFNGNIDHIVQDASEASDTAGNGCPQSASRKNEHLVRHYSPIDVFVRTDQTGSGGLQSTIFYGLHFVLHDNSCE